MEESAASTIDLVEGADLVHALIAVESRALGIRTLAFKGPTLAALGLRVPRVSGDVDVLVDPRRLVDFEVALAKRGFVRVRARTIWSEVADHAVMLVSDSWPVSVDLHWEYPGILVEVSHAFDLLWSRRTSVELANTPVEVPSRVDSALFMLLHDARSPVGRATDMPGGHRPEASAAVLAIDRSEMVSAALSLGIDLRSIGLSTTETGAPMGTFHPVSAARRWGWMLRVKGGGSFGPTAVERLLRSNPWSWPRLLARVLWPSSADVRQADTADGLSRGSMTLLSYRLKRLGRGLAGLGLRQFRDLLFRVRARARRQGDDR